MNSQQQTRHIDHVVVAVHDLEEVANFYRQLGFHVGSRNLHPWGTENRLIQFKSSFIELIAVGPRAEAIPPHDTGRFSFGAFIRDYLYKGEGLAMLVLSSDNAERDAAQFAQDGFGNFEPFTFERKGKRPSGDEIQLAFSLAFALDKNVSDAGFFVCQQHHPENFWDLRFQSHVNGGCNITAVTLGTPAPEKHVNFFESFVGTGALPREAGGYAFTLDDGCVEVVREGSVEEPMLTSFAVQVNDVEKAAEMLAAQNTRFTESNGVLTIPKTYGFGVEIRLEPSTYLARQQVADPPRSN